MNEEIDSSGGPAFPQVRSEDSRGRYSMLHAGDAYINTSGGMSLRQWYAGMAMQAMASRPVPLFTHKIAKEAFEIADAMIDEGNK